MPCSVAEGGSIWMGVNDKVGLLWDASWVIIPLQQPSEVDADPLGLNYHPPSVTVLFCRRPQLECCSKRIYCCFSLRDVMLKWSNRQYELKKIIVESGQTIIDVQPMFLQKCRVWTAEVPQSITLHSSLTLISELGITGGKGSAHGCSRKVFIAPCEDCILDCDE